MKKAEKKEKGGVQPTSKKVPVAATAATMVAFELASGLAVPRPPSFHDRLPDVGVPTGELFAGPFVSSTGTGTAGETGATGASTRNPGRQTDG